MRKVVMILVGMWALAAAPAFADGPYRGQVLDAETKQPIEGAVVVAVWTKRYLGLVHSPVVFEAAKETLTDGNGEFVIPGYTLTSIFGYFGVQPPEITIFKPGYGDFPWRQVYPPPKQSDQQLLEPFKTYGRVELPKLHRREERLQVISSVTHFPEILDKNLANLRRLISAEEMNLGFRPRDWKAARDEHERMCRGPEKSFFCLVDLEWNDNP